MIFKAFKVVTALPDQLEPDALYLVRIGEGFDFYCSDSTGSIAHKLNAEANVNADWDAVSGDSFILNKPSTFLPSSHTQTASTITDFDTEVSNNTDVAANTSARHDAVTVVDSSEIDFTLTGQQITASLVGGSIDESKLGASVNVSLGLADTALQPGDIGVTVQGYNVNTVIDANYVATENSYTTTEKNKLAGIADGAEVNVNPDWNAVSGDAFILNKPSTFPPSSHTQTASTITDFDTEVSNNTDVAANTSARHDAVTVVSSSEIDFTLTGQQITASIVAGSIDESKLDASVNASLNLADTALQPRDILETIILLLTPQDTDLILDSDISAISSFPYNMTITSIRADVDVAPTGSAIVVDMYKNAVTMLDANKFTIAADTTGVTGTLASGVTGVNAGDKISFSINQVGATVPGQYLTVTINGERA